MLFLCCSISFCRSNIFLGGVFFIIFFLFFWGIIVFWLTGQFSIVHWSVIIWCFFSTSFFWFVWFVVGWWVLLCLICWSVDCLGGWLFSWSVGRLAGRLAGPLAAWLAGR